MTNCAYSTDIHEPTWQDDHNLISLVESIETELLAERDDLPLDDPNARDQDNAPTALNSDRRKPPFKGRRGMWIAAGGLVPWVFFAVYVLTLETDQGQMRIESEVDGVRIQLKKDGSVAKDVEVKTGTKATIVSADKYDLEFESPSDFVSMENGLVVISHQDKVVAKIRRVSKPDSNAPTRSLGVGAEHGKAISEPLFDGKTLAQWLDVFRRERNRKPWNEALDAITALTSIEQKGQLLEEVFQACYANRDLTKISQWGLNQRWAERFVENLRNADPIERDKLFGMIPAYVTGKELDPVWKWFEEQERNGWDTTSSLIALMTPVSGRPQTRFNAFGYLDQHYPAIGDRLASILISAPGSWGVSETLMARLSQLAFHRLVDPNSSFESRVHAHRFILSLDLLRNFDIPERNQFALQSNRLLTEVYEHRFDKVMAPEIPGYSSSVGDLSSYFRVSPVAPSEKLVVALFLQTLYVHRSSIGFAQNAAYFDAVERLESACSSDAIAAWEELPKSKYGRLVGLGQLHIDTFLPDKAAYDAVAFPIEASSTDPTYQLLVSYALHRVACFLLFNSRGQQEISSSSSANLVYEIEQFMILDTNQDWRLSSEDEDWKGNQIETLSSFRPAKGGANVPQQRRLNRPAQAQAVGKIQLEPNMIKWAESRVKKMDKDGDGFLAPAEFQDGADFADVDINRDGKIDALEFAISRSRK